MELEEGVREASDGTWSEWKRSFARFAESLAALGSLRWEMARSEAKEWGRAALIRLLLLAAAAMLSFLALIFLVVGLVLLLQLLLGSLLAAVFAGFGICLIAAAALVFAATRGRLSRPIFERTAAEVRKDFEAWTGSQD